MRNDHVSAAQTSLLLLRRSREPGSEVGPIMSSEELQTVTENLGSGLTEQTPSGHVPPTTQARSGRPFRCPDPQCTMSYKTSGWLVRHVSRSHPGILSLVSANEHTASRRPAQAVGMRGSEPPPPWVEVPGPREPPYTVNESNRQRIAHGMLLRPRAARLDGD